MAEAKAACEVHAATEEFPPGVEPTLPPAGTPKVWRPRRTTAMIPGDSAEAQALAALMALASPFVWRKHKLGGWVANRDGRTYRVYDVMDYPNDSCKEVCFHAKFEDETEEDSDDAYHVTAAHAKAACEVHSLSGEWGPVPMSEEERTIGTAGGALVWKMVSQHRHRATVNGKNGQVVYRVVTDPYSVAWCSVEKHSLFFDIILDAKEACQKHFEKGTEGQWVGKIRKKNLKEVAEYKARKEVAQQRARKKAQKQARKQKT